jgi:hypothetical protein
MPWLKAAEKRPVPLWAPVETGVVEAGAFGEMI